MADGQRSTNRAASSAVSPKTSGCCSLPAQMKILYITTARRTGAWLAEALAGDSASKVDLEEARGSAAGLTRLRDEAFDAVLVSHEPAELDALDLIEGFRAGGSDEPIIVLGDQCGPEIDVLCYEVGADAYLCAATATTRSLLWSLARAIERRRLMAENQQLLQAQRNRFEREHDEAQRLLHEQRTLVEQFHAGSRSALGMDLEAICSEKPALALPPELLAHYRELLRTYVIMGSGNLTAELGHLAEILVTAGLTATETMQLHLEVVGELVHGLGARSTRHVMARADLLILEVIMGLAEGYRQRCS